MVANVREIVQYYESIVNGGFRAIRWKRSCSIQMTNDFLGELFASKLRAAVLSWMIPRPHRGFSLTELSRALGLPISSLQHECYKLERIGVLTSRRYGASRRYSINSASPVAPELTALVVRANGEEESLTATLEDTANLDSAFIAAELPLSMEVRNDAGTVIPLVLIGDLTLDEIDAIQGRVASLLNLPSSRLEIVYFPPADWSDRVSQSNPYAIWLLENPRTHLAGDQV
jgi:DNA-binding transcriptional ArsR family regulator